MAFSDRMHANTIMER